MCYKIIYILLALKMHADLDKKLYYRLILSTNWINHVIFWPMLNIRLKSLQDSTSICHISTKNWINPLKLFQIFNFTYYHSPERMSWKTEKAKRMVIPRETRSPDSAGKRKTKIVNTTRNMQGRRMFNIT